MEGEGEREQALAPSSCWWSTHPITEALKAPPPDTITAGIQVSRGFCKVMDIPSKAPLHSEMTVSQTFHCRGAVRVGHPPKLARGQGRCSQGVSLLSCRTAPPGNAGVHGRQAESWCSSLLSRLRSHDHSRSPPCWAGPGALGHSGIPGRDQARKMSCFVNVVRPSIWPLHCRGFYILKDKAQRHVR